MNRREFGLLLAAAAKPVPEKTVVLTFDDAVKSHRTIVGPLLKELGFRATFFVTHRWMEDAEHFLSWKDAAELHELGFEIGNHSWTHVDFSTPRAAARLAGELALVDYELARVKVPKPVSFAWSGNGFGPESVAVLREHGIRFARRGAQPEAEYGRIVVGPAYQPSKYHRLLIPTTGDAYPDWTFEHFLKVLSQARAGQIVVLQFHGVPDIVHPWVHTPPNQFRRYMEYLKSNEFTTLALRDLDAYIDHDPDDAMLRTRYRQPKDGKLIMPVEVDATRAELPYWRGVMKDHGYTSTEAARVTALEETGSTSMLKGLALRPYPGGRHPRIGFLEGMINPMRGTKASVFLPWPDSGYAVIDVPEAVFSNGKLHFLGHTHIPTKWDEKNVVIPNRDWERLADGSLRSEWTLPDKVAVGASLRLKDGSVEMECWVRNGSDVPLKGIRAQVCVMLSRAVGFNAQSNANKELGKTIATVRSGGRWIATEWEDVQRVWGNDRCPCMHSDPKFPDCAPGETVRRTGRLWFGGE